ncbi:MAG: 3-isopropylmalate dehydratase large subunit [Clostridiales bacterium]|nr:3-isopropylmalate dehydratase large subunit [Clostridiales bacterium]MCC8099809.1 3-isopropylmalate dehydratase large subunit [Clostridiales bacterium]MCD7857202.1 3-isopropylmalate dehydratase large subunit [Clostridiales bacterium]
MGMTMTQKILAAHAGLSSVTPGQLIEAKLDLVHGNDVTAPVAIGVLEEYGIQQVYDKDKIVIVLDHYTPCKDIKAAQLCKVARDFAHAQGLTHFYDVGEMGVEHALIPEKGLVVPGDLTIGADSHTCTYGALGAFSTGVGSTDMAAGMASGLNWFKVPSAIKVTLTGKFKPFVSGKDVMLHLIGEIGVDGALYKSLEFTGPAMSELTMDDRFTIANMAIEAGAKNGIFPVDDKTLDYLKGRTDRQPVIYEADPDAEYEREVVINLDELDSTVAMPFLPGNAKRVQEVKGIKLDQVVIGSCTNGRISDMRAAAAILKGRKVAPGVRCIVLPATQEIIAQMIQEGIYMDLLEAGCAISTPTCGPCLGGHMGCMCEGEVAVSTTNRNFVGRMGHVDSKVILASPTVAAASAVMGVLADPAEL